MIVLFLFSGVLSPFVDIEGHSFIEYCESGETQSESENTSKEKNAEDEFVLGIELERQQAFKLSLATDFLMATLSNPYRSIFSPPPELLA